MSEKTEDLNALIHASGPSHGDPATGPSLGVVELEEGERVTREKGVEAPVDGT